MTEAPVPALGRWLRVAMTAAVLGACVGALVVHARTYLPFFVDDAFISLRYAMRFGEGLGLTWSDGERVEGYSNFLWVVLLGLVHVVSDGLIVPARVLGVLCVAVALGALFFDRPRERIWHFVPPLAGGIVAVSSGSVAAWSIGGLEQPLVGALVVWGVALSLPLLRDEAVGRGTLLAPGLVLGLACLARPDSPVFVAAIATCIACCGADRRGALVRAATVALVPAAFVALHVIFRLSYYGEWLPNTYYAKFALTEARAVGGYAYVRDAAPYAGGLLAVVALAVAAAVVDASRRARLLVVLVPLVAWLGYVVAVGGDFFPQRRHLVPAFLLGALLTTEVVAWTFLRPRAVTRALLGASVALSVAGFVYGQRHDPEIGGAKGQVWNWRGRDLGVFLRRAFGERSPLLAVDAAGTLPYFARVPALDMLGLNDAYLARNRPKGFGKGFMGHELGDGAYVLGRKPDLVVFHDMATSDVPLWKSGREMLRHKTWRSLYQRVAMETSTGALFAFWVRKEDGRLGIVREPHAVTVPGFLVASRPASYSRLDDDGRLGLVVTPDEPAILRPFVLPQGRWRLVASSRGRLASSVRLADDSTPLGFGDPGLTFVVTSDEPLRIALRAPKDDVMLWELRFERVGDAKR